MRREREEAMEKMRPLCSKLEKKKNPENPKEEG